MQIVVLCGGKATRLYPLTKEISKSMVTVAGKPFMEYQLDLFKKNSLTDIILCTGFLSEQIEEYFGDGSKFGVKIRYSKEEEKLDTGGALKNAYNLLDDEFFIIYGDSYLAINYQEVYEYFKKFNKLGLMTVYKNHGELEPSNIMVQGEFVKKFDKANPDQANMVHTEFGLNIFKKEVLNLIDNKVFPIGDYFSKLIEKKELLAFETSERFYEIGRHHSLEEFENFITKNKD